MSKSCKSEKSSSLIPLLNDLSDQSFSSIPYVDDEDDDDDVYSASDNETARSFSGRISLDRNVDLSILVHLSDSDREQSDSKLQRKDSSTYPLYLPGFVIRVHNIAGSLKRNSISLPTGLSDRDLESLRFHSQTPHGGKEFENINKSCDKEKIVDLKKPGFYHTKSIKRKKNNTDNNWNHCSYVQGCRTLSSSQ
ncbi:hypothetical protein FF38_08934 [Lucilia cuprina]|uniref:Uncharacterized protein n=1 Tax=Lucilia cuprina TaxID=7375 RepID=A0A0L0C423_LUCCU|nr:hypothetical protein FF38_08934 [Lucilia cuprina]